MIPIIYPDSEDRNVEDIKIPPDIKKYIEKLENVKRFNQFTKNKPGMIEDNSKAHTLRCVYRAVTLPFNNPDLVRTLWIHDIPEYTDGVDVSAVERYKNFALAKKQEEAENEEAKKVFKESDYKLFENFHAAEDFLRRSGDKIPHNQQALVANVIDVLDGNLVFIYFYTKWIQNRPNGDEDNIRTTFKYGLEIRERMLKAIENPKVKPEIRDAIHLLFNGYVAVALDLWNKVDEKKIPQSMEPEILKLKTLQCC